MKEMWTAETMNRLKNTSENARSIRHAADLSEVSETCLRRRLIAEDDAKWWPNRVQLCEVQ
jgi:hypothetical protein